MTDRERSIPATLGVSLALALVVGAQLVGSSGNRQRAHWPKSFDEPWTPSAGAAPFVSLGYREALADYLYVRAMLYLASDQPKAPAIRRQVEAIAGLDPQFEEPMSWGSLAMQSLTMKLSQDDYLAVARLLEEIMLRFPKNYRMPLRAGEIYALRLKSDDPAQMRAWKQRGEELLARAVHLPDAPAHLGSFVAHLRSELGQRDQAIRDLRELILYTRDPDARQRLVNKLVALSSDNAAAIAFELEVESKRFDDAWKRERPELPPSLYVLAGPPLTPWFDPRELAGPIDEVSEAEPRLPGLADDVGELPASP